MKKNLILVALLIAPTLSQGELFLEITKGSEDPYKVAMIPFDGNSRVSKQLNSIIRNDLIRTGEFSILDEELLLPIKIIDEELEAEETDETKEEGDSKDDGKKDDGKKDDSNEKPKEDKKDS